MCSSLSPFPTHLSHITNINPFKNKVWEAYFYKEVCLFVHWSWSLLLSMFPHILCICIYTTWTLTKRLEKKLDGNYTRMLRAILNKSWRQHPTRHQLYGHLPPITKTIQVRRTRYAGHSWRNRDELISDVLLWTPAYGQAKAGRSARTYIQQLCEDTGCCPEELPEAMNDREEWRERVRDIRATSTTWWWWWCMVVIIQQRFCYCSWQDCRVSKHLSIVLFSLNELISVGMKYLYFCKVARQLFLFDAHVNVTKPIFKFCCGSSEWEGKIQDHLQK